MTEQKSLKRLALHNFFVTSAGDMVMKAISLVATFLILRSLAPYDYGVWQLLLSLVSGFGVLTFSSAAGVVVADIAREIGRGNIRTANAIVCRMSALFSGLGVAAALVLAAAAPLVTYVSGINLTGYLLLLALALASSGLRQAYQIVFQAYLEPLHAQLLKNVSSLVYVGGIFAFVTTLGYGVQGLVLAYTLSAVLPVLFYAHYFFGKLMEAYRAADFAAYPLMRLWKESRWTLAEDYVSTGVSSLWPWLVGFFTSISQIGMISIALTLLSQIVAFTPLGYMLRGILPRISEEKERLHEWVVRSMRYSLWSHVVVGVGILGAALVLFPILFPNYVGAIPIYAALLLTLIPRSLGVLVEWFFAVRNQRALFFASALPQAAVLPLLVVLLYALGLTGFVIWQVLSVTFVMLACLWYFEKKTGVRVHVRDLLVPDMKDAELLRAGLAKIGITRFNRST